LLMCLLLLCKSLSFNDSCHKTIKDDISISTNHKTNHNIGKAGQCQMQ